MLTGSDHRPGRASTGLDPSLDPNAPLRDKMKRDEMGARFPLSS